MTNTAPDINQLPIRLEDVTDATECITYLPIIVRNVVNKTDIQRVLQHIVAIVEFEIKSHLTAEVVDVQTLPVNQIVLNIAFRSYNQLLQKNLNILHGCEISQLPKWELLYTNQCSFQLLYARLLTDNTNATESNKLKSACIHELVQAVQADSYNILVILKTLNLLCKKFADMEVEIQLEHIYHCLQSSQCGMREEALMLFTNCCRSSTYSFDNFQIILHFWPWTNRNKFYLLSCILNKHNLNMLLAETDHSIDQFYAGIRLSLSYKSLLAASQYLVKTLSAQNSQELLVLSAEILTRGTLREIQNFYSQWFERITQKDKLFELLQRQPEAALFLENTGSCTDNTDHFRLILIFSIFSRQIFKASKLHFFKISTELITNCFQFKLEAQMLIFKFFVGNFGSFAIEDCLEFILAFMKQHKNVESAQFRNGILGKVPTIINYVAKSFSKLHEAEGSTTLEASILLFFQELQHLIETDITSDVYQPKIFALRLFEILHKSLYAKCLEKNAKNCSVGQNRVLGNFLIKTKVFVSPKMSAKLMASLNDPLGFDDALELVVTLLHNIAYDNVAESVCLSKEYCQRCDVDECVLSTNYIRVALECCKVVGDDQQPLELYKFAYEALQQQLSVFSKDPLSICSNKNHLFGYINIIREIISSQNSCLVNDFHSILELTEQILKTVLELLHFSRIKEENDAVAASFQDMDESLELLVQHSAIVAEDHSESRKFLLMSFWLTLKACCDLATTIGCILVPKSKDNPTNVRALERCLTINVSVLTRCRHKGAIEAAGLTIGSLTKCITSQLRTTDDGYLLLHNCLDLLFDNSKQVSVTRRGAGYSIMLLHVVKNEEHQSRPILNCIIRNIMQQLKHSSTTAVFPNQNFDRIEVLLLHYLCVLVRDTGLRDAMSKHYNDILLATIKRIEHPEWMECNAALQLFGALIPKIVGQKQATEFEIPDEWVTTEVTYAEVIRRLPTACEYILKYCATKFNISIATRSIILFLEFLSKVEHLKMFLDVQQEPENLQSFRELMWNLLGHACEKVRQLAALCFVRIHDIRCELSCVLLTIAKMLHKIQEENFFQGLVLSLSAGVLKLRYESLHITERDAHNFTIQLLSEEFEQNFKLSRQFKPYTLSKLLELFMAIGLDSRACVVSELLKIHYEHDSIGYDVWLQCVQKIKN